VVSYDEISPSTLKEIMEYDKKHMAKTVQSLLAGDDDDDSVRRPDVSATSSPPPLAAKKPLRAGRKKTTTATYSGDLTPLSPVREAGPGISEVSTPSLGRHSSSSSTSFSNADSLSSGTVMPTKKPLRSGRKKVSITATGDLEPLPLSRAVSADSGGLVSTDSANSGQSISSIAKLDEMMKRLEEREREKDEKSAAEEEANKARDDHVINVSSCGCSIM
jgi:hypothetical protein